ncbi:MULTISPECIES: helix-turn-helix transcriptional regulator [Gordonia]|uniref:helix-turn-helix transcriptional regulator n=1 Tax=Gordonia TaxID=2053 RepID=UPI003266A93A
MTDSAPELVARLTALDRGLRRMLGMPTPTSGLIDGIQASAAESATAAMQAAPRSDDLLPLVLRTAAESLSAQYRLTEVLAARHRETLLTLSDSLRRLTILADRDTLPAALCTELVESARFPAAMYARVDPVTRLATTDARARATADGTTEVSTARIDFASAGAELRSESGSPAVRLIDPSEAPSASTRLLGTSTYLAVQIIVDGALTALLYAAPAAATPTRDNAEILALYGSTMSAVLARDSSIDRIARHHRVLTERLAQLVSDTDAVLSAGPDLDPTPRLESVRVEDQVPANHAMERLLTDREVDVIRLIATGVSNAEIADRLGIGLETVKSHVKKILRKVGAVNRAEATALYLGR